MKAISLWQPWASLIANGAKKVETRSWATPYRGPIAIHAAKKWDRELQELTDSYPFAGCLGAEWHDMPLGCVVAVGRLYDVRLITARLADWLETEYTKWTESNGSEGRPEFEFGDYTPGRYAWLIDQVAAIEPIPLRGQQGLWDVELPQIAEVVR